MNATPPNAPAVAAEPEFPARSRNCELLTPPGCAYWVHLFSPDATAFEGRATKPRYKLDFAIPKEVAAESPEWLKIGKAVNYYLRENFDAKTLRSGTVKLGFRDGDDMNSDQYSGCWVLRPWTGEDYPPRVLGPDRKPLQHREDSRIKIGANARCIITPFVFNVETKGIGFNLKVVWLVGGDPIEPERDWTSELADVEGLPSHLAAKLPSPPDSQADDAAADAEADAAPDDPGSANADDDGGFREDIPWGV